MRPLRSFWAALRELTGEADYDRYRRRMGAAALAPGDYWAARWRHEDRPGTRCC
jgi:hypothetical protein